MSGMILHNGAELPGQFAALNATTSQCMDQIHACQQAYNGLLDVSAGRASASAGEFGQHVASTQSSLQDTSAAVTAVAQSHHGEVLDLDGGFAGLVG
jgi:hypothetical protein